MTYNTATAFAGFAFGQRLAALRAELADKAAKRKVYRTTLAELESLSHRDLADLGLNSSMLKSIAFEAAYGN
mgnify:CR=1 FL=1